MISYKDYKKIRDEMDEKCRLYISKQLLQWKSCLRSSFFTASTFAKLLRDDPYGRYVHITSQTYLYVKALLQMFYEK